MQLSVNGKQVDVGEALRTHIEQQLPGVVEKYFDNPTDAQVTLSRVRSDFVTDINVHVGKGIMVRGHGASADAHRSVDGAIEHVAKRLRRYKRRLRDHHRDALEKEQLKAQQYVLQAESVDLEEAEFEGLEEPNEPVVIAEMETAIPELTVGEAVMRLDLGAMPVLMFRNRAHGGLNLVYRRSDGNIGWVDPRGTRATKGATA